MTIETFFGNSPSLWIAVVVVAALLYGFVCLIGYGTMRSASRSSRLEETLALQAERRARILRLEERVRKHQQVQRGARDLDAAEGPPPQDAA